MWQYIMDLEALCKGHYAVTQLHTPLQQLHNAQCVAHLQHKQKQQHMLERTHVPRRAITILLFGRLKF